MLSLHWRTWERQQTRHFAQKGLATGEPLLSPVMKQQISVCVGAFSAFVVFTPNDVLKTSIAACQEVSMTCEEIRRVPVCFQISVL